MAKKVTKKEKFEIIMNAMADNAEIVEFCENEIAALERKALKAKERAAKKKAEGDELKDIVFGCLTSEVKTAADVVEEILATGYETSVGKVIYRLNALAKDGVAVKAAIVIETEEGKKAKRKAFHLV